MSRFDFPIGFKMVGSPTCAACCHIEKNGKTKTAYCRKFGLTFPLYESALYYTCSDFTPVVGQLRREGVFEGYVLPAHTKESEVEPT